MQVMRVGGNTLEIFIMNLLSVRTESTAATAPCATNETQKRLLLKSISNTRMPLKPLSHTEEKENCCCYKR